MKIFLYIAFLMFSMIELDGQEPIVFNPPKLFKDIKRFDADFSGQLIPIPGSSHLEITQKTENERFYTIDKPISNLKYIYVGRVNCCRKGGCSEGGGRERIDDGFEFFDYYIFFDKQGGIRHISIYNYEATHGQEITSRGWLKQFMNYSGIVPLVVGKNIDAISGATISVNALVFDVQKRVESLKQMFGL